MATLAHGASGAGLSQARAGVRTLLTRFAAWRRERQDIASTLRDLNDMDTRDLRDLGITQYDFESIARGAFKR